MENKERALAHIEKIEWVKPIEGADNIELVGVLGWVCIAAKDEFKPGDVAVYIEIDSKCPESDERFAFLAKRKFKIKTLKFGKFGIISQGLAMPATLFPEVEGEPIGADVTKKLHITYYRPDDIARKTNKADPNAKYKSMAARHKSLAKKKWFRWLMKRGWGRKLLFVFFGRKKDKPKEFPNWIIKTDETRIENCPFYLNSDEEWVVSEKADGCFSYRMLVRTDKGEIPIGRIVNERMDVNVASYNIEKDIIEYKPVTDYHRIPISRPTLKIGVGYRGKGNRNKFVECTNNHRFYTNNGWVEAKDLSVGDIIYHFSAKFPYEIKQMILGSLLGDASINSNSKDGTYRCVHFTQSDKQIDYFNYKKQILGKYALGEKTRISGYGSLMHDMHTTTNLDLRNFLNQNCLRNGKKTVTEEWLRNIDPLGLAFWYMDDGSIQNRENDRLNERIIINTQGFDLDEHRLIVEMLHNRFNIEASIGDKEIHKGYVIILDTKNTEKFCSLIAPYVCSSMKYKLPKKYENMSCVYENLDVSEEECISETVVKSIEDYDYKSTRAGQYMYDLTVKDNSNYFVQSILVHNCSCTYAVNRLKKNKDKFEFIVCSRNVRQADRNQECYHESNIYWELADKYNIEEKLTKLAWAGGYDRVVLQGEGVGNVQGNPYRLKENDLYVFNLIIDGKRQSTKTMSEYCENHGFKHVPVVDWNFKLPKTMEEMKLLADGNSLINPDVKREGYVYRDQLGQKSFKNVSREYLLKHS